MEKILPWRPLVEIHHLQRDIEKTERKENKCVNFYLHLIFSINNVRVRRVQLLRIQGPYFFIGNKADVGLSEKSS